MKWFSFSFSSFDMFALLEIKTSSVAEPRGLRDVILNSKLEKDSRNPEITS